MSPERDDAEEGRAAEESELSSDREPPHDEVDSEAPAPNTQPAIPGRVPASYYYPPGSAGAAAARWFDTELVQRPHYLSGHLGDAIDDVKGTALSSILKGMGSGASYPQGLFSALGEAARSRIDSESIFASAASPRNLGWSIADLGANLTGAQAVRDLSRALNASLGSTPASKSRATRKPEDFFAEFETEIQSVSELLRALAVIQEKNGHLGLAWRGQQDAGWAVESSLTRHLRGLGRTPGEAQMNTMEQFQVITADGWGFGRGSDELGFLAELQHDGAPTRLIDVSLDPEVAAWFAVQESDRFDNRDGRLIAWGRSPVSRKNEEVDSSRAFPTELGTPFWQFWETVEARKENEWGTGRQLPAWQPNAVNERMRAQRAAFLFDAEPLIGAPLLKLFNERLSDDWEAHEIAHSTRVIGLPTRHTQRARRNRLGIVPMFSLRISSAVKAEVRSYLEKKGLHEPTIYPDRAGLVSFLRRSGGS